jgi:hypothetical protein
MRALSTTTGTVLDVLTADLQVGEARVIDNTDGAYMPVHVDRLTERLYSLAHYYTQNGDRVCDPDGVFLKTDAGWLPVTLQLCTGHYTEAIEVDDHDRPTGYRPRALRELLSFATMWLRNISQQQGGLAHIRQTITP